MAPLIDKEDNDVIQIEQRFLIRRSVKRVNCVLSQPINQCRIWRQRNIAASTSGTVRDHPMKHLGNLICIKPTLYVHYAVQAPLAVDLGSYSLAIPVFETHTDLLIEYIL